MKTLKTILGLIAILLITTSCTDLSEDLTLQDKIKKDNITNTMNPDALPTDTGGTPGNGSNQDTGGDGGNDDGGKGN
ncbi:hypothetical protein [Tenacibaculum halocynthiae]|uniref:hypothetical protein n=1 Tax=Tenacibaculum halocynthiae TaxID=1254437 RepID=UPI003895A795